MAIIALVVFMNVRSELPVAGEQMLESQGNLHIEVGTRRPWSTNSTPPVRPALWWAGRLGRTRRSGALRIVAHNPEDGGVIVITSARTAVSRRWTRNNPGAYISRGDHIVLAPNDPAGSTRRAIPTTRRWSRRLPWSPGSVCSLDDVDADRINAFIQRYEGLDHHVAGTG